MEIKDTGLADCVLIAPAIHCDGRGCFYEGWNAARYGAAGLPARFVQYNVSCSHRGVLRGLHYQWPGNPQGKLVSVMHGEVFDVAVDLRRGSPTFGKHFSVILNSENRLQLWVPPGFAHGFLALTDDAAFSYLCTAPYDPSSEKSIRWNDPDLKIAWPLDDVRLSAKDAVAPVLNGIRVDWLPVYEAGAFGGRI
ncbi:MAG: dTDP-4-dehydrorhamnose 3,5-epimerase [Pseudomonadota bacterium]